MHILSRLDKQHSIAAYSIGSPDACHAVVPPVMVKAGMLARRSLVVAVALRVPERQIT